MSEKIFNLIQDLTIFFVKENYKKYLSDKKLKVIPEIEIEKIIHKIYFDKKKKLKDFLKNSLKEILKDDYIGDLVLENIFTEFFNDECLCKNRLILEIKLYQQKSSTNTINYEQILS